MYVTVVKNGPHYQQGMWLLVGVYENEIETEEETKRETKRDRDRQREIETEGENILGGMGTAVEGPDVSCGL